MYELETAENSSFWCSHHNEITTMYHNINHVSRQRQTDRQTFVINSLVNELRVNCDRIWENPAYCHACAIILIIIFVTLVITLRNPYLLSYGEINLSSILY